MSTTPSWKHCDLEAIKKLQKHRPHQVTAIKTNDYDLSDQNPQTYRLDELIIYLNENPRHAIVITDLDEAPPQHTVTTPVYVLRGAGEDLNNFYWGSYPAEDPDDIDGGDLTAEEAVGLALDLLCF